MLKFEHFRKWTPEMYPSFQISKYATDYVFCGPGTKNFNWSCHRLIKKNSFSESEVL